MKVLVTGASSGIGRETALLFLERGHEVIGIDIRAMTILHPLYSHYCVNILSELPNIEGVNILVNSAGVQNTGDDIAVNLKGLIAVTERYAFTPDIHSVVNLASTSAHNGAEFHEYAASKGGVLAYTKNVAIRLASYKATCNSISPGAVITPMNEHILNSTRLFDAVTKESLLKKWIRPSEIAEWIYFISVVNQSMTGQDIIIDNGELSNFNFVW